MALRYPGYVPSRPGKSGKYSIVHDGERMAVRLLHQIGQRQHPLLACSEHDEIIEMVNAVKREYQGSPGGAFYINEYQHVIVPTEAGAFFAGRYTGVLEFELDGHRISPRVPAGLAPGNPWPGPRVGIKYVLAAGGNDIYFRRYDDNRQVPETLSSQVGSGAASRLAARLATTRGAAGGSIYINECCEFLAPSPVQGPEYVYLGSLGADDWFPEPEVPRGVGRQTPPDRKTKVMPQSRTATRIQPNPQFTPTAAGEVLPAPTSADIASSVPARDYSVGDAIGGRFGVRAELGSGGFATVYRVLDQVEGEERALKLFRNAAGYDAVRREISALRKVHHPNVVKVIWADRTDAGEWYLIMEYIEGELLAEYTTGNKQLRDREAIDVALDVLSALTAIHPDSERLDALDQKKRDGEITSEEYDELMSLSENALVHRDIKPHNIMLTRSGAKLLDFNIASRVGDPVRTVSGTPPYQPPDADLTRWDVSTDLFAVGVTLYELMCDGQHPYEQARPTLDVEPRDPRQFRQDLSDELADFLMRACASDRSTRFQTAAEMKAALESARASL